MCPIDCGTFNYCGSNIQLAATKVVTPEVNLMLSGLSVLSGCDFAWQPQLV